MQWTLRHVLGAVAIVAWTIAATRTVGIAVTITSLVILSTAYFAFLRIPDGRRTGPKLLGIAAITVVALYGGTFLAFRVFRSYEFSLAPIGDPWH